MELKSSLPLELRKGSLVGHTSSFGIGLISAETILLAMLYFGTARLALLAAFDGTNASPIWPPTGLAMAWFLWRGNKASFPGIFLGAFFANFVSFISLDGIPIVPNISASLLIAIGNSCEASLFLWIAGRLSDDILREGKAKLIWRLRKLLSIPVACAFGAAIGVFALRLFKFIPSELSGTIWKTWWIGDMAGGFLFMPLIISWVLMGTSDWHKLPWIKFFLLTLPAITITYFLFDTHFSFIPYFYALSGGLLLVIHAYSMFQLPTRLAFALCILEATVAILKTSQGLGPFAALDPHTALIYLSTSIIFFSILASLFVKREGRGTAATAPQINTFQAQEPFPFFPLGVGIVCLMLAVALWAALRNQDRLARDLQAQHSLEQLRSSIVSNFREKHLAMERLRERGIYSEGFDYAEWEDQVKRYHADFNGFQAIEWADTSGKIKWVYPMRGNEIALGANLNQEGPRRTTLLHSIEFNQSHTTPLLNLFQGGQGMIEYFPLKYRNGYHGVIIAVYRMNGLFDSPLLKSSEYHIRASSQGTICWENRKLDFQAVNTLKADFFLQDTKYLLELRLAPSRPSRPPIVALGAGSILAAFLALSLLLAQKLGHKGLQMQATLESLIHANALLESARTRAVQADAMKSMFLANMSHEIRTPLNGIIGATSLLEKTELDAEQAEYTHAVLISGKALISIINDILDFSKIEAGKMEIERVAFNLREHVKEALTLFEETLKSKGLKCQSEIASDLPEWLISDPGRIRQILVNLISNAIKFTTTGHVQLKVEKTDLSGASVLLRYEVSDTGIGMQREVIAKLFEPFVQGDGTTTRKFGGTGLGLSISKRLAELLGGSIGVESQPGVGSRFWFTVQATLPQVKNPSSQITAPSAPAFKVVPGSEYKVLIAEDNLVNKALLTKMLVKMGCKVISAENGIQALELATHNDFDLILMDWQMPEMDGLQATGSIRKLPSSRAHVTIFGLTANSMAGDKEACLAAGMNGYLTKPITFEKLQEALAAIRAG